MFFFSGSVSAQSLSRTKTLDVPQGSAKEFIEGEYAVTSGAKAPDKGWSRAPNPYIDYANISGQTLGDYRSLTGRFYFDRDTIGSGSIALYTIGMRGNFSVTVNGDEVFRNFADISDQKNSWYRPTLIPLYDSVLKSDINEVVIHSFSKKTVGIGRVVIGPNKALQLKYDFRYFWNITAPTSANFSMLVLGLLLFIFWLFRRQEIEMLWLSIAAALWFLRNHQYYTEAIPFDLSLYTALTIYSTYFAIAATSAFYICFIKLRHRNRLIILMFVAGVPITLLHAVLSFPSLVLYLTAGIITSVVAVIAVKDLIHRRNVERGVLALGVILMPLASLYDLTMLIIYKGNGHATYLAVFGGLIFAVTFMISFGRRVLDAFLNLEKSNVRLEHNIAKTKAELTESEAIRRELVVAQAVASERGRLMQEMHDGIGSNLTTALAVARQQNQPNTTIKVLNRALGDLKLTVDSLEPVEGDLVALIGNLRHRMARDLADAGITCKWEVEDCAPLEWLDATNALHVLRIHNEAISNVLSHASATELRIGCMESEHDGVAGILTYIADNGVGFNSSSETEGKGLSNIRARARSLHGLLFCDSEPNAGTVVRVWLPYIR